MFDHKQYLAALPKRPGVYRMFGAEQELLYVGKARSLKDRVGTYFAASNVDPKVQALVAQITAIEVTVTNSETEALLLEYNLIKAHKPRFNIVLRDDKSFPYIQLCCRSSSSRASPSTAGRSGSSGELATSAPSPMPGAVRDTLNQLQKLFRIRNCRDSFFANRSRPCLQHQIGRCSAPCVGLITREAYAQDMAAAIKVLEGRSEEVTQELQVRMEEAAAKFEFERAAQIRDQLAALQRVQSQQFISSPRVSATSMCSPLPGRAGTSRSASCWCAAAGTWAPPVISRVPRSPSHTRRWPPSSCSTTATMCRRRCCSAAVSRRRHPWRKP